MPDFTGPSPYQYLKDAAYEARVLKLVLGYCQAHFTPDDSDGGMTFAALQRSYPEFPLVLRARQLPWLHELTPAVLMEKFTKTKLYAAYAGVREEAEDESVPAGLVFPWTGLGNMILHDSALIPPGSAFCWTNDDCSRTIHLNRFSAPKRVFSFLDVLATCWRPEPTF